MILKVENKHSEWFNWFLFSFAHNYRSPLIFEPDAALTTATSATEAETDDAPHTRRQIVDGRCGGGMLLNVAGADSGQSNQSSDMEEQQQQQHYDKGKM